MIYYISRNPIEIPEDEGKWFGVESGRTLIQSYYHEKKKANSSNLEFDLETNGLDAYINDILLVVIGDEIIQYVIDYTTVNIKDFLPENPDEWEWTMQNGKFDIKFMITKENYHIVKMFDTMIAAQKRYQGNAWNPKSNPMGMKFNLVDIIKQTLKIDPMMDKSTRGEFVGVNPRFFKPQWRHIHYAAKDIYYLKTLKDKLRLQLIGKNVTYMESIGLYISYSTAKMELAGFPINKIQWLENVREQEKLRYQYEVQLDEEFRRLRAEHNTTQFLFTGKYDRERKEVEKIQQYDIFGETVSQDKFLKSSKGKKSTAYINWKSTTEIQKIFAVLQMFLPVDKNKITEAVPTYYMEKGKNGKTKMVLFKEYKFTTKASNIHELLNNIPGHPARKLLEILIKYRECETAISTFGENILEKINPVTGMLHTIFRTDNTPTGRFQSGERNGMYPNFQNFPRKKEYRTSFVARANDRSVITADLSGAEVTIMCDRAHDRQLYEWAVKNDDAHSPIATACWKNIFLYRAAKDAGIIRTKYDFYQDFYNLKDWIESWLTTAYGELKEGVALNYALYHDFLITKKNNPEYRQTFKNVTFAAVYNVGEKKAAKMLNIPQDEAGVVLWTIKQTIPATFRFVEEQAQIALTKGVVRIDERTGTRCIFPDVARLLKDNKELDQLPFNIRTSIEGSARNLIFQGTQANMLKEAFVELTLYYKEYNIDAVMPNKVHDEIVTDAPTILTETPKLIWYSDAAKNLIQPKKELFLPVNKREVNYELFSTEDVQVLPIQDFIKKTMTTAANRYMTNYTMGCAVEVAKTWVK